jgi:hypothetical protein
MRSLIWAAVLALGTLGLLLPSQAQAQWHGYGSG